ncbi:hypothetical protein ACIQGZ_27840 [Streptomyces sp. NPDC092296]|uniref:hypothetical protein n=1 Tax=Streptomyces sp. NPDC092296 TaxID=3366012 RepID=UPI0038286476
MWLFPYLTWVVPAGFAAVLVAMAVIGDQCTQLFTSLGSLAVVLVAYTVRRARDPWPRPDAGISAPGSSDAGPARLSPAPALALSRPGADAARPPPPPGAARLRGG